jgi:uncharacterized protein
MRKIFKYLIRTGLALFILVNIVVLFHAYKFTHFYEAGTLPVQQNNSTWGKVKPMLFGINAQKQVNTKPDTACQTVLLATKDSLHLEAWYTTVTNAKGTVCMFHGHSGKKSGNNAEAAAFRAMGYNTFQLDLRAHGSSEGNTCTIGYDEGEDVKLAYDYIKNKGEKSITLWGISMGAATITRAIEMYDSLQPQKIILEMPFGSLHDAVEGRIKMMGLPPQPLAGMLTFWGGTMRGFWAFNFKPQEYVKKIKCPVLLQWGALDPRVTKKETEILYKNITTIKKWVVYESSAHESLCIKENDKWMSEVNMFLQ